jgi:predicted house-cleaning NTP pyrophosphatase (Maf/HAM1 superfamily)
VAKRAGMRVQGRGEAFVRLINGSYGNVLGLPLYDTWELLEFVSG